MRDSTLYIGALASNNVNNIVNDAGKYDEYKEKVKDLTKEIQTRKDTFEKMAEPLVYVCDCYQKFNVVTGMPKSTFGDSFGYDMQKDISSHMTDFYAGKVSREELNSYFEECCTSMRTYWTSQHQTSGTNEADNTQIVSEMYEVLRKKMQGRQVRRTIRKEKRGMKNIILMVTVIGLIIIQIITINAMTPMRH